MRLEHLAEHFILKCAENVVQTSSCFFTEFTEGAKERENHGSDVDWYSCADRGSNWWPVHVLQLVSLRTFLPQQETVIT